MHPPLPLEHLRAPDDISEMAHECFIILFAFPPVLNSSRRFILSCLDCLLRQELAKPDRIHEKSLLLRWPDPITIEIVLD